MRKYCFVIASLLVIGCSASKPITTNTIKNKIHKGNEVYTPPSQEDVEKVKQVVVETKKDKENTLKEATFKYIEQYAPFAMEEMRKHHIPASITMAQGILESNSGLSTLSLQSNNHFGIKCHVGWEGDKMYYDDDEKGECFRKYEFPTTSYQDHSLFLTSRPRYAGLFKYEKDDYISWAKGLKAAGYATDPAYPEKLIGYIEKYELYKYDQLVLGNENYVFKKYVPTAEDSIRIAAYTNKSLPKANPGCHVVCYQETLFSIAKKYSLSVDELKHLNAMTDNAIKVGQQIKIVKPTVIEKQNVAESPSQSVNLQISETAVNQVNEASLKKAEVKDKTYLVMPKDTLFSVSKKFNLTVDQLKQLNSLEQNEIKIGQLLLVK